MSNDCCNSDQSDKSFKDLDHKNAVQNKEASKKQLVELTYRRNVYTHRMDDASSSNEKAELNYRGVNYTK